MSRIGRQGDDVVLGPRQDRPVEAGEPLLGDQDEEEAGHPGQGHVLLIAEPPAAEFWRARIIERLIENDRRQISLDLGLARRYDLPREERLWLQGRIEAWGGGQAHDAVTRRRILAAPPGWSR